MYCWAVLKGHQIRLCRLNNPLNSQPSQQKATDASRTHFYCNIDAHIWYNMATLSHNIPSQKASLTDEPIIISSSYCWSAIAHISCVIQSCRAAVSNGPWGAMLLMFPLHNTSVGVSRKICTHVFTAGLCGPWSMHWWSNQFIIDLISSLVLIANILVMKSDAIWEIITCVEKFTEIQEIIFLFSSALIMQYIRQFDYIYIKITMFSISTFKCQTIWEEC